MREIAFVLNDISCSITNIVVTNDDHYLIFGSKDNNKIIILSLLERKQRTFLNQYNSQANFLAITRDNNYIISSHEDNTIQI